MTSGLHGSIDERERYGAPRTVVLDGHAHPLPWLVGPDGRDHRVGTSGALAADRDDDVADLYARLVGGAAAVDRLHPREVVAAGVGRVGEDDAHERVRRLTALDQLTGDDARLVDGDGEAHSDVAGLAADGAGRCDGAVDAD